MFLRLQGRPALLSFCFWVGSGGDICVERQPPPSFSPTQTDTQTPWSSPACRLEEERLKVYPTQSSWDSISLLALLQNQHFTGKKKQHAIFSFFLSFFFLLNLQCLKTLINNSHNIGIQLKCAHKNCYKICTNSQKQRQSLKLEKRFESVTIFDWTMQMVRTKGKKQLFSWMDRNKALPERQLLTRNM